METTRFYSSPHITRLSQSPHLSWIKPALLGDWLALLIIAAIGARIEHNWPFERDVAHWLGDPSIAFPHVEQEQVPGPLLDYLTWYLPLALATLTAAARLSLLELHHGFLALAASRGLMRLTVEWLKNRVGRLRPDFLDRCQYSLLEGICTGPAGLVKDGRRSFPSGHSATSFQGMIFLVLFIAGKNGAFAFGAPFAHGNIWQSRFLRLMIALSPIYLALWVCVTRIEDNMHHPTDVIAGGTIGTISALLVYHIYFPSPFVSANLPIMDRAKVNYGVAPEGAIKLEEEEEITLAEEGRTPRRDLGEGTSS